MTCIKKNVLNTFSFFPGPPDIAAKPTDPATLPSLSLTGAPTQSSTVPPPTVPTTAIPTTTTTTATPETTTTTTTSTIVEEDVRPAGPNGTGRLLPPTATDAPKEPPGTDPLPPPAEGDADNGTALVPDPTPTLVTYDDDEEEVNKDRVPMDTTEPDMEFPTDPSPHGECLCLFNAVIQRLYPP